MTQIRPATTALEKRQELLAHHVRLVARKASHSLFVYGSQGGIGKSRTILQTLEHEGVEPILLNSHITPMALYAILFQYKEDEVLFFDDVDSMFSSMAHLGLLRSALWGSPRIVTYASSQMPSCLPPSFEFTSRVIFAANVIPSKNDAFKAVLSRCDLFELTASNKEVIDLMRSVSANGFHGLTIGDCSTVIDFIADNCSECELSMRLLGPSLRKLQYARSQGIDWRPLVKSQLQTLGRRKQTSKRIESKSKDLRAMKEAMRQHDNVQDQLLYWCDITKKSRASFYRCLTLYREAHFAE